MKLKFSVYIIVSILLTGLGLAATLTAPVRFKRGTEANLPATLKMGEPAFTTDTHEVYIGYSTGKRKLTFPASVSCSAGSHVSAYNPTTGAYTCSADTGAGGGSTPVFDNNTSTSTVAALSANQGRVLQEGKEPADATIIKESELSSSTSSASTTTAANSAAVKSAYDLANGKLAATSGTATSLGVGASASTTNQLYVQNGSVAKKTIGTLTQFSDGSGLATGAVYRPYYFYSAVNPTDTHHSTLLTTGVNGAVAFGFGGVPAIGTAHAGTFETVVSGNGAALNEHAAIMGVQRYDIGTGYTQTTGPVGRAWFADFNLLGPIAAQPELLNGVTMNIENYYNGSPVDGPSAGQWIVTKPGTGGGIDANHLAAATYPIDVGMGIVGYATGPANGFNKAIQIGGIGSGWMQTGTSKIGTGIYFDDDIATGIDFSPATITGDAIKISPTQTIGDGTNSYTLGELAAGGEGGDMIYPGSGIAVSTGSAWDTSYSAANKIPAELLDLDVTSYLPINNPTATGTLTAPTASISPDTGGDMAINGDFASDLSGWSGPNWAWSSGKALHTAGATNALAQSGTTATVGISYKIVFTVSDMTAGTIEPAFGGWLGPQFNTNGTYTVYALATTTAALTFIVPSSAFDGAIDDVAVYPVTGTGLTVGPRLTVDPTGTITTEGGLNINSEGSSPTATLTSSTNVAGQGPGFLGRKSRGTIAAPTATQSGDTLFTLSGIGYQTTTGAWHSASAYIQMLASENYTSTAKGTYIDLATTLTGTTTRKVNARINNDGGAQLRSAEVIKTASATLTELEVSGTVITNYGETDDANLILTIPDLDAAPGANFIGKVATAMSTYDFCYKAAADNAFVLDGTAGADNGCICNATPALRDKLVCVATTSAAGAVEIDCETTRGTWALVADNTGSCPN
jgi:hypothetical protein